MALAKTASLEIRTPEGVSFSLALASPISRAVAWLLDRGATRLFRMVRMEADL